MSQRHHLVLGGARSGKSGYAERHALSLTNAPTYVATSRVWDDNHQQRINEHRDRRDDRWHTIEEPLELAATLEPLTGVVLVDCLSLWVTNLMFDERDVIAEAEALCARLPTFDAQIIFVSNEVGMGVHPETSLGNRFRDLAGLVNQRFASAVDQVDFIIAGLPLSLKK